MMLNPKRKKSTIPLMSKLTILPLMDQSHAARSTLVDENQQAFKDLLHVPVGPITKARSKKIKEALNGLKRFGLILTWDTPSLAQRKMKV